jgi:hypothetical protein
MYHLNIQHIMETVRNMCFHFQHVWWLSLGWLGKASVDHAYDAEWGKEIPINYPQTKIESQRYIYISFDKFGIWLSYSLWPSFDSWVHYCGRTWWPNPGIMRRNRGIIPEEGRKCQISEIVQFAHVTITHIAIYKIYLWLILLINNQLGTSELSNEL